MKKLITLLGLLLIANTFTNVAGGENFAKDKIKRYAVEGLVCDICKSSDYIYFGENIYYSFEGKPQKEWPPEEENYMSSDEKMFSMMFDIHSEMMGYDRTENICGFGTSLKEMNYAIFKGKKYHADDNGFIVINTNEPR